MHLRSQLWFLFAPWFDWYKVNLDIARGQYSRLPIHNPKLELGTRRIALRHTLVALLVLLLLVLGNRRYHVIHRPFRASPLAYCGQHPIQRLTMDAQQSFAAVKVRQSKSLPEAVAEYRRRYGMPPPPHFDKWYEFALSRGTVLVDEYDGIYHSLLPFWALSPRTILTRTREDLGFHNSKLMGVCIRQGEVIHLGNDGGQGDFQAPATVEMIAPFAQWLPDMDIAFNAHDEPQVVVPREELDWMVSTGRETQARLGGRGRDVTGEFTRSHQEFEGAIAQNPRTRFNDLDHQATWLWSRLSCPLHSPARRLGIDDDEDDDKDSDNAPMYADGPLGLVSNHTAFSDICQSPALRHHVGFFIEPNACKITTELTPVFSMSKPSTFQDILYPSPYYYSRMAIFSEDLDVDWNEKIPQLYWRGGTSGGYSDGSTWRSQLRQLLITNLTKAAPNENQQQLLSRENPTPMACELRGQDSWRFHMDQPTAAPNDTLLQPQQEEKNQTYSSKFLNLKFTLINQCADADCEEEIAFFGEAQPDPQTEAWRYRYLLDMDGNAYSGRFYAFLQSQSVPLKLAFFREWHADTLVPWVHYVPLSLQMRGYVEILRFFEEEEEGRLIARDIALGGKEWAQTALRNEDMEVYMFRLLLE